MRKRFTYTLLAGIFLASTVIGSMSMASAASLDLKVPTIVEAVSRLVDVAKQSKAAPVNQKYSPVYAQDGGSGGSGYQILYYKTQTPGPPDTMSCPAGWTDAYAGGGYGPHYLGVLAQAWYYLSGAPGGGWDPAAPWTPSTVPPIPTECFIPETPVALADGSEKPIADIQVGDMVASFDAQGSIVASRVENVIRHEEVPEFLVTIVAGGQEVVTTPEHRFYVGNGVFKAVRDLKIGEMLYLLSKKSVLSPAAIESMVYSPGKSEVYNLSIEKTRTYFAGGFAVHNNKPFGGPPPSGGGGGDGGPPPSGGGDGGGPPGGSGDPPPPPPGEGPTTESGWFKPKSGNLFANLLNLIPVVNAQTGPYNFTLTSVAIGSDSLCSRSDKYGVPFASLYNNQLHAGQAKLYSRACFTNTATGITECNRCMVCVK